MNFQTRGGLIILISLIGFLYQTSSSHRLLSKYLLFCLITLSFLLLFNLHYLTFFVNNRCVCQKNVLLNINILNILNILNIYYLVLKGERLSEYEKYRDQNVKRNQLYMINAALVGQILHV